MTVALPEALPRTMGLPDATPIGPDMSTGADQGWPKAALLARIADWAGLAERAAREVGDLDLSLVTDQYAYLIETVDEHQSSWWQGDQAPARPPR